MQAEPLHPSRACLCLSDGDVLEKCQQQEEKKPAGGPEGSYAKTEQRQMGRCWNICAGGSVRGPLSSRMDHGVWVIV